VQGVGSRTLKQAMLETDKTCFRSKGPLEALQRHKICETVHLFKKRIVSSQQYVSRPKAPVSGAKGRWRPCGAAVAAQISPNGAFLFQTRIVSHHQYVSRPKGTCFKSEGPLEALRNAAVAVQISPNGAFFVQNESFRITNMCHVQKSPVSEAKGRWRPCGTRPWRYKFRQTVSFSSKTNRFASAICVTSK